jgi:group II intron reverse transcriptase/maturase
MSHGLDRIRQAAQQQRGETFTALLHHVDVELLRSAYGWLRKEASAGVDRVTWADYGDGLERKLTDLHDRIHRGSYRARPSRRVYIPKPDGRERPLGIAALEDKIVQRALVEVLNAIWEEDFLGFSYGFRPRRGQHDALDALAVGIGRRKVNWILDADIAGFFDAVSHDWLIKFVEHRVGDRRVVRLIRKWLKAGVMEDGQVTPGTVGTPRRAEGALYARRAVISPLLANIYLHYVFDLWADQWRKRHARGNVIMVRYADDIVVGFEHQADAERFWEDMRTRLAEFALTLQRADRLSLHRSASRLDPGKTRLIEFGRHAAKDRRARGLGKPETFDFLGFTHISGQDRRGEFQLKRKSRSDRVRAKLQVIKEEMRRRMHETIDEQGAWLRRVVMGFYAYHAVPTNAAALGDFRFNVTDIWRRTLNWRGQKGKVTWDRMTVLQNRWLPKPRITHPWPSQRFAVKHPRWEPGAGIPPAGICAGGGR